MLFLSMKGGANFKEWEKVWGGIFQIKHTRIIKTRGFLWYHKYLTEKWNWHKITIVVGLETFTHTETSHTSLVVMSSEEKRLLDL